MGVAPRLAAAAAAFVLVACGPADPAVRPESIAERLVTPGRMAEALSPATLVQREAEAPATAGLASALLPSVSLGGDTRLVLFRYPSALLAYRQRVTPGVGSRLTLDLRVPASLAHSPRLLTVARVLAGERWQDLAAGLTPVRTGEAGPILALDAALPADAAQRGSVELIVQAFDPADGGRTELRSQPLEIPANAVLDFATGILEPALGQGPVRFSVSACVDGDCRSVFSQVVGDRGDEASAWHDASVSLHEFAGARASLAFETALVGAEPGRFSLPVWANPTILVPNASRRAPRSIVMISVDTLRADHLGSYGYARGTSPGLDRLAAAGTVFEHLIAEAATTDPSHMTMFTSVPAAVHGVTSGWLGLRLPITTLAERLRAAGYLTAAFTEDGPMAHARGFGRGFDVYGENQSPDLVEPEGHVAATFAQARRWLERNGGRPFFLFLHTFQVHSPYAPLPAYRDRFVGDGSRWIHLGPEQQSFRGAAERNAADYDREIRFVDDELSALVDWMQAQGLFANTTLLVLSDHGEQFYEHGELGHGTLPYEEVLRPPLIAYGAGIQPRRVSTPVTHLDLMPTILELAGVPPPPYAQGSSFASELAADGAPATREPRAIFSTSWVLPDGLVPPADAVRKGPRKLIRFRDTSATQLRYYDLAIDPGEARDLSSERPAEARELLRLLDEREDQLARLREQIGGHAAAAAPRAIPLDPAHEEKLRSLGYIE